MIVSEWNALAVGAHVLVHDPAFPPADATTGEVTEVRRIPRGANKVGIRLLQRDRRLVWPPYTAVHPELPPGDRSCWRCRSVREEHGDEPGATSS